jgi:hypothetical protein
MKVALLDHNQVYQGLREIDLAEFDARVHVYAEEFGGDCDLPPGKYYWDAEHSQFCPFDDGLSAAPLPFAPSAEQALASVIRAALGAGVPVGAPAEAWLAAFSKTIDAL